MKAKQMLAVTLLAAMPLSALTAQTFTRGQAVPATMPLGDKPGNPIQDMPPGQRLISAFGERPVFSAKGDKLAFIGKSYGDAFEYDMTTGRTRNLTSHAASVPPMAPGPMIATLVMPCLQAKRAALADRPSSS